jgi:hypothetical protein
MSVTPGQGATPEEFFAGHPDALEAFTRVRAIMDRLGWYEVRISKSQAAFWRKRGFAYVWMPGQYLKKPKAEVVLSIVLGRRDESTRFKEVAHPAPSNWIHHLEIRHLGDLDEEVVEWLREAAEHAE